MNNNSPKTNTPPPHTYQGFTLAEILVVVTIMIVLSSALLVGFVNVQKRTRDNRRVADIEQIRSALNMYKRQNGTLPEEQSGGPGSWESGTMTNFLNPLLPFMSKVSVDPINILGPLHAYASSYYYAYHFYGPGWLGYPNTGRYYGCDFDGTFAVIAIRHIEAMPENSLPKATCGTDQDPSTPQFDCNFTEHRGEANACRDWGDEFDYSIIIR